MSATQLQKVSSGTKTRRGEGEKVGNLFVEKEGAEGAEGGKDPDPTRKGGKEGGKWGKEP